MSGDQNPGIDNPQEQGYALAQMRIEALRNSARNIRETRITPELVSSLFHSARSVGEDVMGLNPVAATIFSMGFGSVSLTSAASKEIGVVHHTDETTTEVPLNTPSDLGRTVTRYIHNHFNRNAEFKSHQQAFREARKKFSDAGISSEYLDDIWEVGARVALDIFPFDYYHELDQSKGIDESKFTVKYFKEMAKKVPERPRFIMDQDTYPEFIQKTGGWLHGRFEEIINNVMSSKYLMEQEMG